MRKGNKTYQLGVLTRESNDYHTFHQLKNKVSYQLDTAKSKHIGKEVDKALKAHSKWRELNNLGFTKIQLPTLLIFSFSTSSKLKLWFN